MSKEIKLISSAVLPIFTLTLFLSAFLLFLVQPMFAKMILPLLGGTPNVWNTCVLFFQLMLLLGYGYSHLVGTKLKVNHQFIIHFVLLLIAVICLPLRLPQGASPPTHSSPVFWLLTLLSISVGLPFFVVSTMAPLLQKWFSFTKHPAANDPYFLYAASNLGSLIGLISYPAILEPVMTLQKQSWFWSDGFIILVFLTLAGILISHQNILPTQTRTISILNSASNPGLMERLKWILFAFIPSSLMLGVTTFITTDIASIPLLWVIPLTLYLLTFIIAFSAADTGFQRFASWAFPIVILPIAMFLGEEALVMPIQISFSFNLVCFFLIATFCHGQLASLRPQTGQLTEYYFWLSFGGMLGGLFNSLIAPYFFNSILEYPLLIFVASFFYRESTEPKDRGWWIRTCIFPIVILIYLNVGLHFLKSWGIAQPIEVQRMTLFFFILFPTFFIFSMRSKPIRFALCLGVLILGISLPPVDTVLIFRDRSFFGVHRVIHHKKDERIAFTHGTTIHGYQSLKPEMKNSPLTYYSATGPAGKALLQLQKEGRCHSVAIIGLGTGSLAAYGREGQNWDFYEIDPIVKYIAEEYFTFLKDSKAKTKTILGDGRLQIQKASDHFYDVLIIDAFSSDSIPIHIITRQALEIYLSKLKDHGVIIANISNRHLKLESVFGDLAETLGLSAYIFYDTQVQTDEAKRGKTSSIWVLMARNPEDIKGILETGNWKKTARREGVKTVWTDDFSNILSVYQWNYIKSVTD